MSKKYNVGDNIIYSTKGICTISSIEKKAFGLEERDYYVLSPIFDSKSTYYIPVDYDESRVVINSVLSPDKAEELFEYSKSAEAYEWIINQNLRKQTYDKIYKSGNREEIIRVIRAIKNHETEQKQAGKHLYAIDERILKGCVNLITGELAFVLGKAPDDVKNELNF